MRFQEIFESEIVEGAKPVQSSEDFAKQVLIAQYGFKGTIPGRQLAKWLSKDVYIGFLYSDYAASLFLFSGPQHKTLDKIHLYGVRNNDLDFSLRGNDDKILNKITEWTKQFANADPEIEMAESSLVEAVDLNMNSTNGETDAVIKLILQVMKAKGYKGKRYNQSAMFEVEFLGPGPRINIDGWHGNGTYGTSKVLFSVYKDGKAVIDMSVKSEDLDDTKRGEYWASEDKKQSYVDGLARVKQMFQNGSIFK